MSEGEGERPAIPDSFPQRLRGALIGGLLLGLGAEAVLGFALLTLGRILRTPALAAGYSLWLYRGGWITLPMLGAATGAFARVRSAPKGSSRSAALVLALGLGLLGFFYHPALHALSNDERPRSAQAKAGAILRWSYGSPAGVEKILALSGDPDARVREQAMLALGDNLIVTDIEHASAARPSRFASYPVRARLRGRLLEALRADSSEGVRAEAARALWKAPVTFGRQQAAAETLVQVLARALRPDAVERLTWLALDAAAGTPDAALKAAAARFATATPDTELARAALRAAGH